MSLKEIVTKYKPPVVMAFGNPVLDKIVVNQDNIMKNLLEKQNLALDTEIEKEHDHIEELLEEIKKIIPPSMEIKEMAGGSALNTMRFLQKLCGSKNGPKLCVYYGGLGHDEEGKKLKELVESEGIDARYAVHKKLTTAVGVDIITGPHRCLVVHLGAAAYYTLDDLKHTQLPLDSIKILYIEGFFITHSLDVAKKVAMLTRDKNMVTAFNLSGEYIFEEHHNDIIEMISLAKIIFGNVREMTALAKRLNIAFGKPSEIPYCLNQVLNVTLNASEVASTNWLKSGSVVVMSQGGSDPAIVVWGQGESHQVTPQRPRRPVLDTTGAGDALVAGFLAGLLAGQKPQTCLEWGCRTAGEVVTQLGAALPDDLAEDFLQPAPDSTYPDKWF